MIEQLQAQATAIMWQGDAEDGGDVVQMLVCDGGATWVLHPESEEPCNICELVDALAVGGEIDYIYQNQFAACMGYDPGGREEFFFQVGGQVFVATLAGHQPEGHFDGQDWVSQDFYQVIRTA